MQLTIIIAIFVAIAGGIFAMQNNVPVTVNFLLWRFDSSLAMVLLLSLALGAIIAATVADGSASPPPYVGLKQIAMSHTDGT